MVEEAERMKLNILYHCVKKKNILYHFFLTFLHVSCSLNQRKLHLHLQIYMTNEIRYMTIKGNYFTLALQV
jgi:hypothetical protein